MELALAAGLVFSCRGERRAYFGIAEERPTPYHRSRGPEERSRLSRGVWMAIGWVSVVLGGIGVVVPGLPTTGFMVFAASCFAKSSPRFEQWILDLPKIGPHVRAYRNGEGMPKKAKITALTMMTLAVGFAAGVAIDVLWLRVAIVVAGLIGWWFLLFHIPTTRPMSEPGDAPGATV